MREEQLKRLEWMIWRRTHATYVVTPLLAIAIAVWLIASHAATQWWALEGAPLLFLAYLFFSLADLNSVVDKMTGDKRNVLRFCAFVCIVVCVALIIKILTGHIPLLG